MIPRSQMLADARQGYRGVKSHQHRPLREACRRAGIDPRASFHILRHTDASHLLQAEATLPVIAANLGHSDTRTTERHYAHLVPSHVTQIIRATMPKLRGPVERSPVVPPFQPQPGPRRLRNPRACISICGQTACGDKMSIRHQRAT